MVAVPAQIYAITRSSAYVGLTGLFGLVPLIVFGLWGGALADHADRRSILRVTTLGLIVTSAAFWAQAALGLENVWLLLILFAVQQAFFAINQPTRSAVLPRLLPPAQLPAANSLNMTVTGAGAIAGPLVGGALIPVLGFSVALPASTRSRSSPTLWAVIRLPKLPPLGGHLRHAGAAGRPRRLRATCAATRAADELRRRHHRDGASACRGRCSPRSPTRASVAPPTVGSRFALLFAGIPAGAVLGGVLSGWVSGVRRQGRAVVSAIMVWGVAMAGFGVAVALAPRATTAMLVVAVLALMVGGAADMASAAFRSSMLQSAAADDVRGRLQGVFIVVVVGGPRLADVLHGAAAAVIGPALTAFLGGVLVLVLVTLAVALAPGLLALPVRAVRTGAADPGLGAHARPCYCSSRRLERLSSPRAAGRPRRAGSDLTPMAADR